MVGSYSPHADAGGTLHLPSPTHIHHVDPTSALRQLRRSLSRSPSKISPFRLVTAQSPSPSQNSPFSPPTKQQPHNPNGSDYSSPTAYTPSSARKTRPGNRRLSPLSSSRSTSTPRSPRKRGLHESANHGNAVPQSSPESSDGQENQSSRSVSPINTPLDLPWKTPVATTSFVPPRATAKFEKGYNTWGAKSSPLKRSDGTMNLDFHGGSPSAKRRSLHGGIFGPDFDIFEHASQGSTETKMSNDSKETAFKDPSKFPTRASSLRKSTVQQRLDKPTAPRSRPHAADLVSQGTPTQLQKSKFRMSLDNNLLTGTRDSPFSSQSILPNASVHPIPQRAAPSAFAHPQRHPLSRTISQSTSTSSVAEDSPTHVPIRQPEQRHRTFVDFSKSVPVGATRPSSRDGDSQEHSSGSFSTPENYKLVKPLPAAFMSTGLISKRHKDMESKPDFGASTSTMPDTPCKRHSLADIPSPSSSKVEQASASRQSGPASARFSPRTSLPPGNFDSNSIFGLNFGNTIQGYRLDGDEGDSQSPSRSNNHSSPEFDVPPTPTRFSSSVKGSHFQQTSARKPAHAHRESGDQYCKYVPHDQPGEDEDGDISMDDSPSVVTRFKNIHSHQYPRLALDCRTPPSSRRIHSHESQAKSRTLSPASPESVRLYRLTPRTPKDCMIPPDPSGLSISQHNGASQHARNLSSSGSMFPPATPTASKELWSSSRQPQMTPSHAPPTLDVDPVLTARFDKVDIIGTGEFSQVFRVSRVQDLKSATSYFSIPVSRPSRTPLPDQVWAIKKSRYPYIGPKDRYRKLQEVETLRTLGTSDHTLEFCDSWEVKNHLYIQTEFCEEGNLDAFLSSVGYKARLDDFRIWKILLELSLGVKHIHDAGFIHLDLKPANVLVTFEGTLKIADFGMATRWPAQAGIEGEGDREYIGPEILKGQYDKPADIFALGLIMLEIAGNVVLPDNGLSWQRLRSGDMSDVPSLTWSSENSNLLRDSSGKPLSQEESLDDFYNSIHNDSDDASTPVQGSAHKVVKITPTLLQRSGELAEPPSFMIDPTHAEVLDHLVRWMISPAAHDRPVVHQVLDAAGVRWTEARRRAGATIFEGNWGPADDVLADDAEMIDV